jgi:hypothetical protein
MSSSSQKELKRIIGAAYKPEYDEYMAEFGWQGLAEKLLCGLPRANPTWSKQNTLLLLQFTKEHEICPIFDDKLGRQLLNMVMIWYDDGDVLKAIVERCTRTSLNSQYQESTVLIHAIYQNIWVPQNIHASYWKVLLDPTVAKEDGSRLDLCDTYHLVYDHRLSTFLTPLEYLDYQIAGSIYYYRNRIELLKEQFTVAVQRRIDYRQLMPLRVKQGMKPNVWMPELQDLVIACLYR